MVMEINSNNNSRDLVKLKCSVQTYDWGQIGHKSLVANLFQTNCNESIDSIQHYAELWMGTHPSGPSFIVDENQIENLSLKSWISKNPQVLGQIVIDNWGIDLPFMFKVISNP